MALLLGITGAVVALATPALANSPVTPKISATQTTFAIPSGSAGTWTLRLWSHGTLEGTASGTSGTLTVPVPSTSDCTFQADVTVLPPGGQRYYYSGTRATVPGCGPVSTLAGHIYLCSAAGAPTTSEVAGGTLAATGPQAVTSQPNPLSPLTVQPGSYSMTAASPSGYVLVTCGGSATIGSNGTSASEPVVVPSGGNGVGTFYVVVAAPTGSLGGGNGTGILVGQRTTDQPRELRRDDHDGQGEHADQGQQHRAGPHRHEHASPALRRAHGPGARGGGPVGGAASGGGHRWHWPPTLVAVAESLGGTPVSPVEIQDLAHGGLEGGVVQRGPRSEHHLGVGPHRNPESGR